QPVSANEQVSRKRGGIHAQGLQEKAGWYRLPTAGGDRRARGVRARQTGSRGVTSDEEVFVGRVGRRQAGIDQGFAKRVHRVFLDLHGRLTHRAAVEAIEPTFI